VHLSKLNSTYLVETTEAAKRKNRLDTMEDAGRIRKYLDDASRSFARLEKQLSELKDKQPATHIDYLNIQNGLETLTRSVKAHFPQLSHQATDLSRKGQNLLSQVITYRLSYPQNALDTLPISHSWH
jgi:uncharacterized membrane protein YgaE (UPF0421/DUF939 family)